MPITFHARPSLLAIALSAATLSGSAAAQELGIPQGSGLQAGAAAAQAASKSGQVVLMPALTAGAANTLSVLSSQDGANFVSLASETWSPPSGRLTDPTLARHADGRYVLAYASGAPGTIGLATSQDLRRWEFQREIKLGAGQARAPAWLRGADGRLHMILTLPTANGGQGAYFVTPDDKLTGWGAPARCAASTRATSIP